MSSSPISSSPQTRSLVRPRSATRGPLDPGENPIMSAAAHRVLQPVPRTHSAPINSPNSPFAAPRNSQPPSQRGSTDGKEAFVDSGKDFAFLLRPELYHPISNLATPTTFRESGKQPLPTDSLQTLLARGHFRAAAIAAAQELTGTSQNDSVVRVDPLDAPRIFSLVYTRLVCLVLIDATTLAAQEGKLLEDLNGARYIDPDTGEHLVPWELRVLNVRLQGIVFGDPHRTVMSYYDLAREARAHIIRAQASEGDVKKDDGGGEEAGAGVGSTSSTATAEMWTQRLHDLGIRVAGALVEMNDLVGAAQHLDTLKDRGDGKLALAKALVWLQVGDTDAAMRCVKGQVNGGHTEKIAAALCDMAGAAYGPALIKWTELREVAKDEMVAVNAAICLLYLGRIGEGRDMLEAMVGEGYKSHTLLFNLSTMYELCSDNSKDMKLQLADKLADLDLGALGWEKTTMDLKL